MSDTESDEDVMPNNGLYNNNSRAFNSNMTNFNNPNLTSYTFKNNMKTFTFNTADLHKHRDGMRGFGQRSMYCRREMSPMSLRSFPASQMQYGMSSQRSVYNGRGGSPVSMRSIDSNAFCITAKDIAFTFKNAKFNKYDFRIIKEAYNQLSKKRLRKRIEKKRKLRLFLKGNRRRSGDDSGELGSDSSISSDDCRSTRTFYKENITMSKTDFRTDLLHFRNTVRESDMVKDCTENLRQNSFRNKFAVNNTNNNNHTSINNRLENTSTFTLKERFAKGSSFLLPSQRFNKSIAKPPSNQTLNCIQKNNIYTKNTQSTSRNNDHVTDSDNEDVFPDVTIRENTQRKRLLENDDDTSSARKRNKINLSPIKHNDTQRNDFDFKKPQMPMKKSTNPKKNVPEVLIAKSRQPLTDSLDLDLPISSNKSTLENDAEESHKVNHKTTDLPVNSTEISDNQKDITQTSDVSMRPSFIKRKLFTQKLDVAEKKNTSSDNIAVNSPQTKLYSECGEKNRVRKLVTSQSCLSRDVLGDNNVLDLIHKIVPPDKINMTNVCNKKDSNKSNRDSQEKWDVTSVISMCNENDGSDTYTDEEIFKASVNISKKPNTKEILNTGNNTINKKPEKTAVVNKPKNFDGNKVCQVVVQKLQPDMLIDKVELNNLTCEKKRTVSMCVKSFWDTDFESDMEDKSGLPWKYRHQAQQAKTTVAKDTTVTCSNFNLNSTRNTSKGTILTVKSFQNKGFNSSRSDISRLSKRKEPDVIINQEQKENEIPNKNTNSKQIKNDEKKQEAKNSKSKKEAKSKETGKTTNKEHKEKTLNTKEKNNNTVQKKETKNSKSKKDTKSSAKSKTKNEEKAIIKEKNVNKKQNSDELNSSRASLRLKQKEERANLTIDTTNSKKLKPIKKSPEKEKENINKNKLTNNKKPKETTKKDTKMVKTPSIKNSTINRTRQTPRKFSEKQIHLTDNSSLNISNISNRSLRTRRNIAK